MGFVQKGARKRARRARVEMDNGSCSTRLHQEVFCTGIARIYNEL